MLKLSSVLIIFSAAVVTVYAQQGESSMPEQIKNHKAPGALGLRR
jgi:hypothetical protein